MSRQLIAPKSLRHEADGFTDDHGSRLPVCTHLQKTQQTRVEDREAIPRISHGTPTRIRTERGDRARKRPGPLLPSRVWRWAAAVHAAQRLFPIIVGRWRAVLLLHFAATRLPQGKAGNRQVRVIILVLTSGRRSIEAILASESVDAGWLQAFGSDATAAVCCCHSGVSLTLTVTARVQAALL
jgi:hypothetical protein